MSLYRVARLNIHSDFLISFCQLRYVVWCTDSPNSRSNSTITVTVPRNLNAPDLENLPSSVGISRSYPVAIRFYTVIGSDADGDNVTYILSPSATERIRERFFVFPGTGVVILRRTISTETQTRYVVSLSQCSIYRWKYFSLSIVFMCLSFNSLASIELTVTFCGPTFTTSRNKCSYLNYLKHDERKSSVCV